MCHIHPPSPTKVNWLAFNVPSWKGIRIRAMYVPTLQAQWKGKCKAFQALAHCWSHSPRRHSWSRMWSRSNEQRTRSVLNGRKLTIVCKEVPQASTIPRLGGGDIGVGGQDVPHMSQPTMNSIGGSTLPQWQNWRSLIQKILLVSKFSRRL